jgi:hypothetical protein
MSAKLFRENGEVSDSDIHYSHVGPGHERAYLNLIPLAGYAARSRFNDFPYFTGPFHIYSMGGWKPDNLYKSVASAKAAIRRLVNYWLFETSQALSWTALETGVHFRATANGIEVGSYYFCPEETARHHKGFRVYFGGTYYTTDFESPDEARAAVQETFSRWLDHAKQSLL